MLLKTFLTTLCITSIGTNIGSANDGHWKPLEPVSVKNKIQYFQNLAQSQIQEITPVKTQNHPAQSTVSVKDRIRLFTPAAKVSQPIKIKPVTAATRANASVEQSLISAQAVDNMTFNAAAATASIEQFIAEPQAVLATRVSDTLTQFAKLATDLSNQHGVEHPSERAPAEGQRYFAPTLSQKLDKTIQMALALEQLLLEKKAATSVQPALKPKVLDVVPQALSPEDLNTKIVLRRLASNEDLYQEEDVHELFMDDSNFQEVTIETIESLNKQLDSMTESMKNITLPVPKVKAIREIDSLKKRINAFEEAESRAQAQANYVAQLQSLGDVTFDSKFFAANVPDESQEDLNDWSEN